MAQATALTIGNFDGVHLGHVALVKAGRAAVGSDGRVVALAFDPHPLQALNPAAAPPPISTFEQRAAWLARAGADEVVCLRPTGELLGRSPEQFLRDVVRSWAPQVIVEGPDFRFGAARAGSVQTLADLGGALGFRAHVVEPVEAALADRTLVRASSSLVRWLVRQGRVRDAGLLLGRPYELTGVVRCGARRGRELGVPTANLDQGALLLPADGIYAGAGAAPDGRWYPAAISVGTKPTFGEHPRVCEAHLIGYRGPLDAYDWTMTLRFDDWIRDQIAYSGIEPLKEQIARDIELIARHQGTKARREQGACEIGVRRPGASCVP
jgi:riboflavin kinase/FMN adenylyltransferase